MADADALGALPSAEPEGLAKLGEQDGGAPCVGHAEREPLVCAGPGTRSANSCASAALRATPSAHCVGAELRL